MSKTTTSKIDDFFYKVFGIVTKRRRAMWQDGLKKFKEGIPEEKQRALLIFSKGGPLEDMAYIEDE